MLKKVCLISDHHLSINPRLWKEAFLYEELGFEVVIITQWISDFFLKRDLEILDKHRIKYIPYLDLRPGRLSLFQRFFYRARKRIGGELMKLFKINNGWALSYAPEKLYGLALKENADLYASHLESGLLVGCKLIGAGKKVSFDFEDWYSRDYLTKERPVLKLAQLEEFAIKNGIFCTAASNSMSDALMSTYNARKKITTIYNSFPKTSSTEDCEMESGFVRVLWTSRTVGPDRGLETLVEALVLMQTPIEVHIIGECSIEYRNFILSSLKGTKHLIVFIDFIKHTDLMKKIQWYHIGLAIEQYTPESRNKTITNKILQYIQAGLKVLATDTDGQSEVANYFPESVFLVQDRNPEIWKNKLKHMIFEVEKHDRNRQKDSFEEILSWESQKKKLEQLINQYL
jgi:glycosyltransferase involved in cell wall biosynthesis